FTNEFYLLQEIVTPTHSKGNTLDLFFTNNSHLLHSYESNETLFSDHYLVEGKINYRNTDCLKEMKRTSPNRKKYSKNFEHLNFFSEKIKWEKVSEDLQSINWRLEYRGLSPDEMLNSFFNICFSICEKYVPQKRKASTLKQSKIP
ncbi:MAG TPA: hypothetical protein DDE71_05435, partial [Tenacibaculum sp.]|nr:hypothetical protein [Tenacibaculum sp.]